MPTMTKKKPAARKTKTARKSAPPLAPVTSKVLTAAEINEKIERINEDKQLTPNDRRSILDKLLGEPLGEPTGLYEVETYVLPGGIMRAISVSGQTIQENTKTEGPEFYWPLIDIYRVTSMQDLKFAVLEAIRRDQESLGFFHRGVNAFRHVEILGPSMVHHDPTKPLDNLPRRACVMFTQAPLRVYVDTVAQAKKNGKGHEKFNPDNFSGRFGC